MDNIENVPKNINEVDGGYSLESIIHENHDVLNDESLEVNAFNPNFIMFNDNYRFG